jgi:amidohydrolase
LKEKIKQLTAQYFETIKGIREHIHQHPELSFKEINTSAYVEETLRSWGITNITRMAGTGLVVIIEGANPNGRVIGLRSELDALPIQEKNSTAYCSVNDGIMHACGHDVHTACLLGTAKILQELRNDWNGIVKLIIQPGEEKEPGGASIMIKEGVLNAPTPELIIAQHVHPSMENGKVGFKGGLYMASADEIYITVKGKGGHGALPQNGVDTVLLASHIVVALQQIVSRNAYPIIPSVLSFGKIIANGATNVIPDEVRIEGTFRTMNETWRKKAHENIEKIAKGIAQGMGGDCLVEISNGYPCLINDPQLTETCTSNASEFLGAEQVEPLDLRMTAEDFSFFAQELPVCFYRLGTASKDGSNSSPVHTATFDIDEEAIKTGVGLMTWLAYKELTT